MAGTFTHWMVAEQALDQINARAQQPRYFPTILSQNHFVCLGAVGPDYPYLTELLGGFLKIHSWADRMHFENTGKFIQYGIANLPSPETESFSECLAWLCGYLSHIITDCVIHPIVNAIVGPYIFNSSEHRHCEMTQDTYIFNEIKGVELSYADYGRLFTMCSHPSDRHKLKPGLCKFWKTTLKSSHPGAIEKQTKKIDPDTWHKEFLSKIAYASDPMPIFRHFMEEEHLSYKKSKDLSPEERERFIDKIKLPGEKTGSFKKDAFDKAVAEVSNSWSHFLDEIENGNPDAAMKYIKNWNLDTGVDEDNIHFWSSKKR